MAGGSVGEAFHIQSTVYFYDPKVGEWKEGKKMRKERTQLGLIEYDGRLYAIGGISPCPDGSQGK